MGNGAVKNIVLLMVLLVFSVLVGSQISGGFKDSFGAFMLIGGVVCAFGMLLLGKHSWYLLYYLPALLVYMPHALWRLPLAYAACFGVFVSGLLMWMVRIVSLRWRAHAEADILVAVLVGLFVWNYIQHPVSMRAFNPDAEYVGGEDFVWGAFAVCYYLAMSCMSGKADDIVKAVHRSFYILCGSQAVASLILFYNGGGDLNIRYEGMSFLASPLLYFVFCSAPVGRLLISPRKILLGVLAVVLILFCGRREVFGYTGEAVAYAAVLKREILSMALCCFFIYGGFFFAGSFGLFQNAPYSLQRVVAILPGVKVGLGAEYETRDSNNTRRRIWAYAFDTRYGRILDYVWGDGFQTDTKELQRAEVSLMRGIGRSTEEVEKDFASGKNWHNGWLTTIKAVGIVGLTVVNLIFICGLIMMAQLSAAYRYHRSYPHIMAQCLLFAQIALSYMWGTQTLTHFFKTMQYFALIKLLYCAAREKGMLRPFLSAHHYVPMMIEDIQQSGAAPRTV